MQTEGEWMGEVTRQCADWRRMNEGRWPASTAKENFQPRSVWLETEWCKGWSGYDRKDANLITPEECKIQKKMDVWNVHSHGEYGMKGKGDMSVLRGQD